MTYQSSPMNGLLRFPTMVAAAMSVALLAGLVQPSVADEPNPFCAAAPRQQWVSAEEVGQRLRKAGYKLIRLRMADDKCYGAVARDAEGRIHDLVVHPVTVEIMR